MISHNWRFTLFFKNFMALNFFEFKKFIKGRKSVDAIFKVIVDLMLHFIKICIYCVRSQNYGKIFQILNIFKYIFLK